MIHWLAIHSHLHNNIIHEACCINYMDVWTFYLAFLYIALGLMLFFIHVLKMFILRYLFVRLVNNKGDLDLTIVSTIRHRLRARCIIARWDRYHDLESRSLAL